MRLAAAVCVLVALSAPRGAAAEEGSVRGALPLERAVEIALEGSLDLRAARAELTLARARLEGDRVATPFNPELFGAAGVRFGAGGPTAEAEGGLAQVFELGGPRRRRIAAAEAAVAAASRRGDRARDRVRAEATIAWVGAVEAGQLLRLSEETEVLTRRLHAAAEERGAADAATDLEVNLAAIEWARARRGVAEARRRNRLSRAELARVLALGPGEPLTVPAELPPRDDVSTPLVELVERALEARADLSALDRDLAAARAEVRAARAAAWPDLEVSAAYAFEDGGDHIVAVGLSLPLPLFERGQGEIAEARAGVEAAEVELERGRRAVARSVEEAHASFEGAASSAEILGEDVLSRVEQNLELLELSFDEGSVGLVQVLTVQRQLLATRREIAQGAAEALVARARLELAVGGEVE